MRIHSLKLRNFRQHQSSDIEFGPGLTGIIGPNGSGKSTVLEAIAWAIYGTPAARGTRESIKFVRADAKARVSVELDFQLGPHRYRVVRGLTSAELYLDADERPIATSISVVSELLRKRIGMSLEEFFNTYFTGQKELSIMAAMKPTERAQFLSRVLGYERLRTAQDLVRDRRKLIIAEITGLQGAMANPDAVTAAQTLAAERLTLAEKEAAASVDIRQEAGRALGALVPKWESLQRDRDTHQTLSATRARLTDREDALARDAARLLKDRDEVAAARAELESVEPLLAEFERIGARVAEFASFAKNEVRRQSLIGSDRELQSELARLMERRAELNGAPQLERELTAQLSAHQSEFALAQQIANDALTSWIRDKQEAETTIKQLRERIDELKVQREALVEAGENGTCPICNRTLNDHYRQVLDLLDEQRDGVVAEGKYFRARTKQLESKPDDLAQAEARVAAARVALEAQERRMGEIRRDVQELAKLERDLASKRDRQAKIAAELSALPVGYDAEQHTAAQRELDRLTPLNARRVRAAALVEREPRVAAEASRVDAELASVRGELGTVLQDITALGYSDQAFAEFRAMYDRCAMADKQAEMNVVAARGRLDLARSAQAQAEQAAEDLARAQRQVALLSADRRLHDELDRAFTEMRDQLNLELRPEIAERASRFLEQLTDGRYERLDLDDSYNAIVTEDGIPKPVISGGEEDLTNLVLRLAISEMIAERAGQPLSLLVLDEVFGSLDELRRNNVVELLRGLRGQFEQVILITHVESVREGLDRVITVRYDEATQASRVEQDAGPKLALVGEGSVNPAQAGIQVELI